MNSNNLLAALKKCKASVAECTSVMQLENACRAVSDISDTAIRDYEKVVKKDVNTLFNIKVDEDGASVSYLEAV